MVTFEEFKKLLNLSDESAMCSMLYELYQICKSSEGEKDK